MNCPIYVSFTVQKTSVFLILWLYEPDQTLLKSDETGYLCDVIVKNIKYKLMVKPRHE